jgi:hypothetical protein
MNETVIIHWILQIIVGASILHLILPPYDVLDGFPTAQKYYKLFVRIVEYFALNVRTKVIQLYPSMKVPLQLQSDMKDEKPPAA